MGVSWSWKQKIANNRIMNKRYFLQISTVLIGTAFFSRYINWSSETMALSNTEFAVTKTEEDSWTVSQPEPMIIITLSAFGTP